MLCEEFYRDVGPASAIEGSNRGVEEPILHAVSGPATGKRNDVELLLGVAAGELDPPTRTVLLGGAARNGVPPRLRYDRLVIATGSRPRHPPGLSPGGVVHELRSFDDALVLRAALHEREGDGILGAGLIGMEVAGCGACAGPRCHAHRGRATPLARALPPALGHWIADLHRHNGVRVRLTTRVERRPGRGGTRLN